MLLKSQMRNLVAIWSAKKQNEQKLCDSQTRVREHTSVSGMMDKKLYVSIYFKWWWNTGIVPVWFSAPIIQLCPPQSPVFKGLPSVIHTTPGRHWERDSAVAARTTHWPSLRSPVLVFVAHRWFCQQRLCKTLQASGYVGLELFTLIMTCSVRVLSVALRPQKP